MAQTSTKYLWSEKYRPLSIKDCIFPSAGYRAQFEGYVEEKFIPNIILAGTAGTGKTSVARAMIHDIGASHFEVNCSLDGGISTLRMDIQNFITTKSIVSGRKYVLLDEADYLTDSTQAGLRNFMETYSKNAGFIMTANFPHRIIEPLSKSRCVIIPFEITQSQIVDVGPQIEQRLIYILENEDVKFSKKVLRGLIEQCFPDIRKMINRLQTFSRANGSITEGILAQTFDTTIDEVVQAMKARDFKKIRTWAAEYAGVIEFSTFLTEFYNNIEDYLDEQSVSQAILILADYQRELRWVANQEIHIAAMLMTITRDCSFR